MDNVQKTYIIFQSKLQDLNKGEQEELIQLLIKKQNPETKDTEPNRTRIPTTNQEPNPIQPNK